MLCVGSADDACGGWTSTVPILQDLSLGPFSEAMRVALL